MRVRADDKGAFAVMHTRRSPQQHTCAIIPVVPLLSVGTLGAAYLLRAPILSRALGWWLGASVKIKQVDIAPLNPLRRWTLKGVRVSDRKGAPLCSFERLRVGSRIVSTRVAGVAWRHRQYGVELSKPEVVAVFDNIRFTSSNWSRWGSCFRSGTDSVITEAAHDPVQDSPLPRGSRVKLDVKGGLLLSLRYASDVTGGTRIINDVRLTDLDGVGDDLLSPRSIANLVEKLCSKAIQHASWYRFENREGRRNARAFSRNVLRRETRSMRALARVHIKRLRKNVSLTSDLLGGLPDMTRFVEAAKQGDAVLSHIEQWLKLVEKPRNDDDQRTERDEGDVQSRREVVRDARRALSAGAAVASEPLAPSPPPSPADLYLELDEEWQQPSPSLDGAATD